jgi:hypothetical protein
MKLLSFALIVVYCSLSAIPSESEPRLKHRTPPKETRESLPAVDPHMPIDPAKQPPACNIPPIITQSQESDIKENFSLLPDDSFVKKQCLRTLSTLDDQYHRYNCESIQAFLFCATQKYFNPHVPKSYSIESFCGKYRLDNAYRSRPEFHVEDICKQLSLTPQKTVTEISSVLKIFQEQKNKRKKCIVNGSTLEALLLLD